MSDTPTLANFTNAAIKAQLLQTNICMPGIIRSYDADTRKADIQPVLNKQLLDGESEEFTVIPAIPVQMPGGNSCSISLPLQQGDMVLLVFSQKSMDAWLDSSSGDATNPNDSRRNDLQDAIAIPGVYPFSLSPNKSLTNSENDVIIVNKTGQAEETTITLKGNGDIQLKGAKIDTGLDAALEPSVLGDKLATWITTELKLWLDTHVHTGNLGAPTSPPLLPFIEGTGAAGGAVYSTVNRNQ